jgi:hypothetical protein
VRADNPDWWNLVSIHGGGLPKPSSVYVDYKALAAKYADECTKFYLADQANDATTSENFCPHANALFAIWHRPYVLAFELLLEKYDPGYADEKANRPIAAHYWKWEDGDYLGGKDAPWAVLDPSSNEVPAPVPTHPEDMHIGPIDPLPTNLKKPVVKIFYFDSTGKRKIRYVNNPLMHGPSGQWKDQRDIIREYQWGNMTYLGMGQSIKSFLDEAMAVTDYSTFCTITNTGQDAPLKGHTTRYASVLVGLHQ